MAGVGGVRVKLRSGSGAHDEPSKVGRDALEAVSGGGVDAADVCGGDVELVCNCE